MSGIDTQSFIATLGVNRAARESAAYFAASGLYLTASLVLPWIPWALAAMALVLFLMGCWRLRPALLQRRFEAQLIGDRRPWLTMNELIRLSSRANCAAARWLGYGFAWDTEHCQNVQNLVKTNWKELYRESLTRAAARRWLFGHPLQAILHPFATYTLLKTKKALAATTPGFRWIHALGKESPTFVARKELEGHMAVFGTTGSGKSRFLEVQIAQAILQGHCVIVLDPKGDKGLENSMRLACIRAGREGQYLQFHLAHPETSVNLDLLANFTRAEEIASRIADTLPGQGGEGQVFVDMARGALRSICDGLRVIGTKPTVKNLLHYYGNRDGLAFATLEAHLKRTLGEETVKKMTGKAKSPEARLEDMRELYLSQGRPSAAVDSVLGFADLDGAVLSKMTQSLVVVLGSLSRGDIGNKLSPDSQNSEDHGWWDSKSVMRDNRVLYVGLDAMTDSGMARVIGTLFLSDLTASAGARYDFECASAPVALFVDEAAELTCEPFTQLLNKSRGAKFSICLASQTIADFVAKANNEAQAMRILANVNNCVALRCIDEVTQEFFVKRTVGTRTVSKQAGHDVSAGADRLMAQSGSVGERLVEEEATLIPAPLLGALPNGEFFGVFSGGHVIKGRVPVLVEHPSQFHQDG